MAFDIEGARKAGYTDAEITDYLSSESNFDAGGARNAGYSDQEIIEHLTAAEPQEAPSAAPPEPAGTESPEQWQQRMQSQIQGNLQAQQTAADEGQQLAGFGAGVMDLGQGLKQAYLQATGGDVEGYTKQVQAERAAFEQTPEAQAQAFRGGRIAGTIAPTLAIPGAAAGATLPLRMAVGGGTGAAIGAGSFVPEGESRLTATGKGALIGAAAPAAIAGAAYPVAKIVNAAKGRFASPKVEETIQQGEKFDVPVLAPDVMGPGVQKTAQYLEDVPVIGMRGTRTEQMQKAQQAAEKLRNKYAQQGSDDIGRIIQTGMKNKAEIVRTIKAGKYTKISEIADELGVTPTDGMQKTAADIIEREMKRPEAYRDTALMGQIKKYTESPEAKFSDLQRLRAELGEEIRSLETNKKPIASSGELGALKEIKRSLENDMASFATASGDDLAKLWKNADKYYKMKFLPFKEKEIQNAIKNDEPDRIFNYFVKDGYSDKAKKFYNSLDNTGRQAVRYGMIDKAYQKAYDEATGVFSPAKFATQIDKLDDSARAFFKGSDYGEIKGFANLMRHVQRAGQAGPGPATGVQAVPLLGAMGVGALSAVNTAAGVGALASTYGLRMLFTSKKGRALLTAAATFRPGSPGAQRTAQKIEELISKAGAVEATRAEQ